MLTVLLSLAGASVQGPPIVYTAPPAPPPPPIITTPLPPPPMVSRYPGTPSPAAVLDIRVSSEGGVLLEDSLRVGPQGGASVTQSRSEAAAAGCAPPLSYERSIGTNFRLNVQPTGGTAARAHYRVDVSWTRPGSGQGCTQDGSRTATLQQSVDLASGQEVTLRGDAGLTVRIRRR